ncbi:ATP-binding protein [Actinophytocola xanthii]|uniref:ATPase n=1 Tax=Actinophytocola xanthii TaxID=1912961 RepID=A0A1Q8CM63_9PSEU|nr:AAA family ATPase [Actinophytocola xanthii]OLF15421.1 ATPase [Actinophytocola xanthii]
MAVAELIGRAHPAALLRAEIERVVASHGGLVLVTGEAGIGKTTLVTAAMDTARRDGALVLSGSCWDSAAAPGYWPWVQVIRALRRHSAPEEWAAVEAAAGAPLTFLLGDTHTTEPVAGFQLYDAVTNALVALAQRRPVVVVLDDLHWADPESVRLLEFVAQHTWFERLLLVGTYRDVEVEASDHPLAPLMLPLLSRASTVTLGGLDEAEVGALITRTTGVEPAAELVGEVHRRTGGNPFFVEQTARLWHSGGALTTVAPGVRDAVRRRLSLLAPAVSALLASAAVLGREFDRRVLAAVVAAPVPQVARLLDEAVAARLVLPVGDGRFAFAHDLVRETLYESLDVARARSGHAAVVRALESSSALAERVFPADLARHAYLAGAELPAVRVVDHLVAAAKDARRRMAFEEAGGHYRRALELLGPREPRRARVCLQLANLLYQFGPTQDAPPIFQEAAEVALTCDDPELLARVALTLFSVGDGWTLGSVNRAELLRAAHDKLIDGGEVDRPGGKSLDHLAQELILHLVASARDGNDDDQLGFGLWTMHDTLWGPGNAAERQRLTDELVTIARRTGDREMEQWARSLGWVAALELGEPAYHDRFTEFVRLSEDASVPSMAIASNIDQSIIAALHGRFAEAEAFLGVAVEITGDEHEHPHFGYTIHHLRWALAVLRGDWTEVEVLRERVVAAKHPYPELLEGIAAALRGDVDTAARCLATADARTEPIREAFLPLLFRLRAHVASLVRDSAVCERARAELTPYADFWLVSLYGCDIGGPVRLWLAMIDAARERWSAAVEGFTAALRSAELLGARPWVVEAKLALASALRGRADPADAPTAARLLAEATHEAGELGIGHRASVTAPVPVAPANEFRRTGAVWTLTMAGRTVHMPDAKGLRDLHVLLSAPGTEIPATRLLNPGGGEEVAAAARLGGDDVLDAQAKAAYRRRLTHLDERIAAATDAGADRQAADLDREREALLTELRTAAGLAGRPRRLGDEAERARKAVTARIRDTLRKLDARHPELATHLRGSVSTGTTCSYAPSMPTSWRL